MTPLTQIHGDGRVAAAYGLEEAIFLHALMFWYRTNRGNGTNFRDGRWWTYNSVKAFESVFPWWNGGQIRRIIARCKDKGALLFGDYNEDRRDRTTWYTPSDELLSLYGETDNCSCRNRQMQSSESAGEGAENGECNIRKPWGDHGETDMEPPIAPHSGGGENAVPESDTVPGGDKPRPKPRRTRQKKSVPTHAPERFEQFWEAYPGGGSRLKAVEAWDALAPDDALIDTMAAALKQQMASRMWRDGVGIPHACRWLSNRRWTDKLPEPPRPRDTGGWADGPG